MDLESDSSFFITKVDYQPSSDIVDLVTSSDVLVMALKNSKIIRLDLQNPSLLEGMINQYCQKVSN